MPLYKLVDYFKLTLIPKVLWPQTHLDILFGKIREILCFIHPIHFLAGSSYLSPLYSVKTTLGQREEARRKQKGGTETMLTY